jgi:hypothetical protein
MSDLLENEKARLAFRTQQSYRGEEEGSFVSGYILGVKSQADRIKELQNFNRLLTSLFLDKRETMPRFETLEEIEEWLNKGIEQPPKEA